MRTATQFKNGNLPFLSDNPSGKEIELFSLSAKANRIDDQHISVTFGLRYTEMIEALITIFKDCSSPDWDCYGALPVTYEAIIEAAKIINLLPYTLPVPDIYAEPTGDICFEWNSKNGYLCVICVSGKHKIGYAGIFGESKTYGLEYFEQSMPSGIVNNIRRVYA